MQTKPKGKIILKQEKKIDNIGNDQASQQMKEELIKQQGDINKRVPTNRNKIVLKSEGERSMQSKFEMEWSKLNEAVDSIFSRRATAISREELYQIVQDICIENKANDLYSSLSEVIESHAKMLIKDINKTVLNLDGWQTLLSKISSLYSDFCTSLSSVRSIFFHLDRTYCMVKSKQIKLSPMKQRFDVGNSDKKSSAYIEPIWETGMYFLKCQLLLSESKDMLNKITESILTSIENDRAGEVIDGDSTRNAIQMFLSLDIYHSHFETVFLATSTNYFRSDAKKAIEQQSISQYLTYVIDRIGKELALSNSLLDTSTKKRVIKIVEMEYIGSLAPLIIDKGLTQLLDQSDDKALDLSRLYQLFARVNVLELLRKGFMDYVQRKGEEIIHQSMNHYRTSNQSTIQNSDNNVSSNVAFKSLDSGDNYGSSNLISQLIQFHIKLEKILQNSFGMKDASNQPANLPLAASNNANNATPLANISTIRSGTVDFSKAMRDAFEQFLNIKSAIVAESVARFFDEQLRSSRVRNDLDIEKTLDEAFFILKLTHGKDVFEAYNKNLLAKRLLTRTGTNNEIEHLLISKLKGECGASYANKLSGVFKDIDLSSELMNGFNQDLDMYLPNSSSNEEQRNIEFYVNVLAASSWQSQEKIVDFTLPSVLVPYKTAFEAFYSKKFKGRSLTWQPSWSTCIVKTTLPLGKWDLDVSMLQATVLLAFSRSDTLTFGNLLNITRIEEHELQKIVQSLVFGKSPRILRKLQGSSASKVFGANDEIEINMEFKSQLRRIKIESLVSEEEIRKENVETQVKISENRNHEIEAAIVRIMKSRKTLQHTQLISELFKQLRFQATPAEIKKRIESLIERE